MSDGENYGEQSDESMEDVALHARVEEITNDPELSYAIKSSRRSLLQHVAQQTPTCTFAQLRETHGPDGQWALHFIKYYFLMFAFSFGWMQCHRQSEALWAAHFMGLSSSPLLRRVLPQTLPLKAGKLQ